MRRLLLLLPPGTLAVGAGLVVLGGASYVHLAIASRTLTASADGYDGLAVLWSIVFTVGLGLFFPIEQELTRVIAARRVSGDGATPVFRRGVALSGGMLLAIGALLAIGTPLLADRLFNGQRSMVLVLIGGLAGLAVCYPTRGALAGSGRFGAYGTQLAVDGGLRIMLAILLGVFGVHSAALFGLILTVAPIVSVAVTAPAVRAACSAGSAWAWSTFRRGVIPLMISTLLAQLVVNVAVINVKLIEPEAIALAGALLNALVLVRVPLFAFAALQASLLPGLSGAAASQDRPGFRRLLLRACAIVLALALAGALIAVPLGTWLLNVLFARHGILGDMDFAILAAGTGGYLLAQVLGQGAMALGHHRDQMLAWLGGTVALAAITAVPGDLKLRVELGYAIGSATVALLLAIATLRRSAAVRVASATQPVALVAMGGGE